MKKIIQFSGLLIIVLLSGFCNLYGQKPAIIKGHVTDSLTRESMLLMLLKLIRTVGLFQVL